MKRTVFGSKIGIQVLSDSVIRVEYTKDGEFFDDNTFFIPDRDKYIGGEFSVCGDRITVGRYTLVVPDRSTLKGMTVEKDGETVYTYRRRKNSGELPPLCRTPEVFAVFDAPRITVPECGYSPDGEYLIEENTEDVYLLLVGRDGKKLRKTYVELTGRPELVRLSTLGLWDSRYFVYSDATARQRVLDYEAHGIPLDNIVIDTDWRAASDRGIGYDVDTKLFPDMADFLAFAHSHGVDVMFNDHPEPLDGALSCIDPKEIAYRSEKLQGLLSMGLDTWWYDRNWHTKLISPTKGLEPETWGLYLFHDITEQFYRKKAGDSKVFRRPDIMGNVNNIRNGKYTGKGKYSIVDSASHRYSIQWTGDITSDPPAFDKEVENLIAGGDNCIPYINFDCGGHIGNPDALMYTRWMQFGALSPVLRPHCTISVVRSREPWAYGEETEAIVKSYIELRYRLLPVIYKAAFDSYMTGEPVFKSLGYCYPDDKRAAKQKSSYMLGSDILYSPVNDVAEALLPVPEKNYVLPVKATFFDGREWKGKPLCSTEYKTLNKYWDNVPPHKGVPVYDFSARFETELMFDKDIKLAVESDDGVSVWLDGELLFADSTTHAATVAPIGDIKGGAPHKLRIDYFQAGGEASISLLYSEPVEGDAKKVYLPAGRWLDAFDGSVHEGEKTVSRKYPIEQNALFIRLGSAVPLAYNTGNSKTQDWSELVFDCYPDSEKTGVDEGAVYEDDGETTAYKYGGYRMSPYKFGYDSASGSYRLDILPTQGGFDGKRAVIERTVKVKFHELCGMRVKSVLLNGKQVDLVRTDRCDTFPLGTSDGAPDSDVITAEITFKVDEGASVEFIV